MVVCYLANGKFGEFVMAQESLTVKQRDQEDPEKEENIDDTTTIVTGKFSCTGPVGNIQAKLATSYDN